MHDKEFKDFAHKLADGDTIASRGTALPDSCDYRPDIAIKDSSGSVHIILESERKSERKAFIGAMVHAAMYAQQSNQTLTLVFVMKETGNQTTVAQVSENIRPYFTWLRSLGVAQLMGVFLISDTEYDCSARANERLLSDEFLDRCTAL